MTEPKELEELRRELTSDILNNLWDQGSRLQGMLAALDIESVLLTVPDKYGEQDPVIAIPISQYDKIVKVITSGVS